MKAGVRRLALATAVCAAAATAQGCTVPTAGVTGISVTEEGQPLGVLVVCHDHMDVAVLYTDGDKPDDLSKTVGRWSRTDPVTGFTTWPLDTGGDGWTVERSSSGRLAPDKTYTLFGGTHDNSWSTASVDFTVGQLAALVPGEVRYYTGERDGDADVYRTTSMADFRSVACRGM
ncbi:hypothetical protein [Streptomyces sp. AK02-01A]|uniref:hypothetical protein n=1 Tax=Streptomyces sp. AK02-01A TaxID=3028648 RepID=UPI0029B13ACF|nr:hypothetical protein [Streptomyces sp. AK02-01A]MDX3850191.1 hypothetical protein [Streptomyces sp. AK02-01A]